MINLTTLLELINKNPWLNILFIVLAVLGIFFTIFFYIKSIRSRKPIYCIRTINLVKEKTIRVDSISILFEDNKIDNLSISKIAIWNEGRETINYSDIAKNDLFRIESITHTSILDCQIIFEKNSANGFKVIKSENNRINIEFDYFDKYEGIVIQVYHTGTMSSDLLLKGSFKGTKSIIRNDNTLRLFPRFIYEMFKYEYIKPYFVRRTIGIIMLIFPLILSILFLVKSSSPEKIIEAPLWTKLSYLSIITIPYWWLGYRFVKRPVPKGFNIFEDEF